MASHGEWSQLPEGGQNTCISPIGSSMMDVSATLSSPTELANTRLGCLLYKFV